MPVELTSITTADRDGAVDAFNDACDRGFTWCGVSDARAFTVPACPDEEVTPERCSSSSPIRLE